MICRYCRTSPSLNDTREHKPVPFEPMRPPEQYLRHALKYEAAVKRAKSPRARKVFKDNAKRFRALAMTSLAMMKLPKQ